MSEQLAFDWQERRPRWIVTRCPRGTTGPFETEADARAWTGSVPTVERRITQDPWSRWGHRAAELDTGEHPVCDQCENGVVQSDVTRPTRTPDGEWGTAVIGTEDQICRRCNGTTIAGLGRWIADLELLGYTVTVSPVGQFVGPDHATHALEHPEVHALWDLPARRDLPDGHLAWVEVHKKGGKDTYEPPKAPTQNQMRGHVSAA